MTPVPTITPAVAVVVELDGIDCQPDAVYPASKETYLWAVSAYTTREARPVLTSQDACSDTCNDTCIALSGRVQRHLYFDLLGRSAWGLMTSVTGIAGHQYDAVF
jgi:hypothetical protein